MFGTCHKYALATRCRAAVSAARVKYGRGKQLMGAPQATLLRSLFLSQSIHKTATTFRTLYDSQFLDGNGGLVEALPV